jgi:superfamily II DNA/RNA helicase
MQTKVRRMSAPENTAESIDMDTEITEALSAFAPVDADATEDVEYTAGTEDTDPETEPVEPIEPVSNVFTGLPSQLIEALRLQGIVTPTPVQEAVIPDGMDGRDVLGRAQTGSGKTLAFGIPILAKLAGKKSRPCHPRAVIVVPTRELANQVAGAIQPLAASLSLKMVTVYGGTPYDKQTRQLRQRADIVVATPGRLEDLLENGYCFFDDIEITILDEADHLCDLGFYPAVDKLVGMTPAGSQRMLLSATLDGDVDKLVRTHLRSPRKHELDPNAGSVTTMAHHTLTVGGFKDKVDAAVRLVEANGRTIVFTRTREGAVELAEALTRQGVDAVDLHGNLSQKVRERNLHRFSSGAAQAVVATDVAARGIHVDNVNLVIHFDPASDAKAYLHRSGRTARAGSDGCVVTITTPKFVQQVVRTQAGAGVVVLHHDIRTAPESMTAKALAKSGGPAPAGGGKSYAGKSSGPSKSYGGNKTGGYQGKRTGGFEGRGDSRGPGKSSQGKSWGGKPAGAAAGKSGGKTWAGKSSGETWGKSSGGSGGSSYDRAR